MATVKSGTVVKSSGPATPPVTATPAGPPATDTGTVISSVGTAGCPVPPKPTNSAVTVTVVEAPSFTQLGLTLNWIRLSSSKINKSSPNTSQPAATPDTPADSEPSNKASAAPVSQKLPVPLAEPAGMAIVKSSTAPPVPRPWKSAASAVPPPTDTVTTVSVPGNPGSPAPPKPTSSAVTSSNSESPSATLSEVRRKTTPRRQPATPSAAS